MRPVMAMSLVDWGALGSWISLIVSLIMSPALLGSIANQDGHGVHRQEDDEEEHDRG